jgi:hypothetical protein
VPQTKTIVCLANSFRPGGSCVAGIEYYNGKFGNWVRPISKRLNQAINNAEKSYENGTQLAMLDVVRISFDSHTPKNHQTENWVISSNMPWKKLGTISKTQLGAAVAPPNHKLWGPTRNTNAGLNDELIGSDASATKTSLILIQPDSACVEVIFNPYSTKNDVWVSFLWANLKHKLKLTDPVQFNKFIENSIKTKKFTLSLPILCISMAEVWEDRGTASLLVAGLIV